MQKKIVYFDPDSDVLRQGALQNFCERHGILSILVNQDDLGAKVIDLVQQTEREPKPDYPKVVPALCAALLCGFSGEELSALLTGLSAEKITIPLKAVLTEHNQNWLFGDLLLELEEERQAFLQQKK